MAHWEISPVGLIFLRKIRSLGIAQYIAVRRDDLITIGRHPADGGVREMTDSQKREIANLRAKGNGYGKIALALGISQNTVKSYCRRNNIGAGPVSATEAVEPLKKGQVFASIAARRYTRFSGIKRNGSVLMPAGTNGGIPISIL